MKKLAIYGAGGFGREMVMMIDQINEVKREWELVGFFDDGIPSGVIVDGLKVLGGMTELNNYKEEISLCVSIADPRVRQPLVNKINNSRLLFPTLVHPQCNAGSKGNIFGKGCILTAGVILTVGIHVGEFSILNLASTIGHDVKCGDFVTVMPGCSISGNVNIGARTVLGAGARIIQGLSIGEDCVVGAGSVVTKSFGSNLKLLGVPARKRAR